MNLLFPVLKMINMVFSSTIVTNPPIRAGKKIVYDIVMNAKDYLEEDGKLFLVIRKEQGAKSLIVDLQKVYNVKVLEKKKEEVFALTSKLEEKIQNLEKDIMLSLAAMGIRIIAPMPGKGTIGIEVPNANPKIASTQSLVNFKLVLSVPSVLYSPDTHKIL